MAAYSSSSSTSPSLNSPARVVVWSKRVVANLEHGQTQALDDHSQYQIPLPRALGAEQPVQTEALAHRQDRLDVPVGQRAFDCEGVTGGDQGLVLEGASQALDFVCGPIGEIGEGALADFFAVAPAFAQEDGGAGVTIGDGLDIHGN